MMKRTAKQVLSVLAGLACGVLLYVVLAFGIFEPIRAKWLEGSPEAYLGVAFLILMPVSLIIAGLVVAYLSRRYHSGPRAHLWSAGEFYLCFALLGAVILPVSFLVGLEFGIAWSVASWVGLVIGFSVW